MSESAPTVVVDVGNSFFHLGWIENGLLNVSGWPNGIPKKSVASESQQNRQSVDWLCSELQKLHQKHPALFSGTWLVMSVHPLASQMLETALKELGTDCNLRLLGHSDVPIPSDLENRERTGIDRLLAGWYAATFHGNLQTGKCKEKTASQVARPTIIVDAGSAVTVDWVDATGIFRGGMIFPGIGLAARSLAVNTDALPETVVEDPLELIEKVYGRHTTDAIGCGILWQQWGGICHAVKRLQQITDGESVVVITGGGSRMFETLLPEDWRLDRDLNLKGLLHLAAELQ